MCDFSEFNTYYYNRTGKKLNSLPGLYPIPLYKGMRIVFEGHPQEYIVVEWSFHIVDNDKDPGLRIILE